MKHRADMIVPLWWIFGSLAVMVIVSACSNGTSHTGTSNDIHPDVLAARDMVRPLYPRIDDMRLVMEEGKKDYAMAHNRGCGCAYITTDIVDYFSEVHQGDKVLGCFLVHEYAHHVQPHSLKGQARESQAYAEMVNCLRNLKAPQYWIDRYQSRV